MEYTKTNWANGDVITAEKMNNLENGVEALATQSPPDWNQNDPNGDGYIANRPFYIAGETNTEIVNNTFSFNNSNQSVPIQFEEKIIDVLEKGMEFTAYYDGTYYSGEIVNNDVYYFIGNCSLVPIPAMTSEDNINMPFLFLFFIAGGQCGLILKDFYTGKKNISISIKIPDIHKIDSKYLPDSNFDLSDRMTKGVDDNGNVVDGAVTEGLLEDKKITIPGGTFTILKNKAIGMYSHAEGQNTTASGENSHAEGKGTTASTANSHAEGIETTASGGASHAEGQNTTASNYSSHAEGQNTTASGADSHAEGQNTTASGFTSHAEGNNTIAKHRSQHVFGEYNVEDPSSNTSNQKGTYVEIVGNGSNSDSRSNARTLDWQGNEVLAGSLTLGSTTITEEQLKKLLAMLS